MSVGAFRTASRMENTNLGGGEFISAEDVDDDITNQTLSELDGIQVRRSVSKGLPSNLKLSVTLDGQLQALSHSNITTPASDKHALTEQTLAELVTQLRAMSQVRPALPDPANNEVLAKLSDGTRLSTSELLNATNQLREIAQQLDTIQAVNPISASEMAKGYELALPQASSNEQQQLLAKQFGNLAQSMGATSDSLDDLRTIAVQDTAVSKVQSTQLATLTDSLRHQSKNQLQVLDQQDRAETTALAVKTRDDEALDDIEDERELAAKQDKKDRQATKRKADQEEKDKKKTDENGNPKKGFFAKALTGDFMGMREGLIGSILGDFGLEDTVGQLNDYLAKVGDKGFKATNKEILTDFKNTSKETVNEVMGAVGSKRRLNTDDPKDDDKADPKDDDKADPKDDDKAPANTQRNVSDLAGVVNDVPRLPAPEQGLSTTPMSTESNATALVPAVSGSGIQSDAAISLGTSRAEDATQDSLGQFNQPRERNVRDRGQSPSKSTAVNQFTNLDELILNAKKVIINGDITGQANSNKQPVRQGRDAPTGERNFFGAAFGKLVTQVQDSAQLVTDGAKQLKDSATLAKNKALEKGKAAKDKGFADISKLFNSDSQDKLNALEIEIIEDESKLLKKLEKTAKSMGKGVAGAASSGGGVIDKMMDGVKDKLFKKLGGAKSKIAGKLGKSKVGQFFSKKFLGGRDGAKRSGIKGMLGGLASTVLGGSAPTMGGAAGGGLLSSLVSSVTGVGAGGGDCCCDPMADGSSMPYDMDRGRDDRKNGQKNSPTKKRSMRDRAKGAYSRGRQKLGGSRFGRMAGRAKGGLGRLAGMASGGLGSLLGGGGGITSMLGGGGITSLLGGGGITSLLGGGGVGSMLGGGISKVAGAGSSLLGGLGSLAGKAGPLAMAGMALMDGVNGWQNAGTTFGLEEGQEASTGQKMSSAVGGALSGLTMGLLDGDSMSRGIHDVTSSIGSLFGFGDDDEDEAKAASDAVVAKKEALTKSDKYDPFADYDAETERLNSLDSSTPALVTAATLGDSTKDLVGKTDQSKTSTSGLTHTEKLVKRARDKVAKTKARRDAVLPSIVTEPDDSVSKLDTSSGGILSKMAMASPLGLAATGLSSLFGGGNDGEKTAGKSSDGILSKLAMASPFGLAAAGISSFFGSDDESDPLTESQLSSTGGLSTAIDLSKNGLPDIEPNAVGKSSTKTSSGGLLSKMASYATLGLSDSLLSGSDDKESGQSTVSKLLSTMAMSSPLGLAAMSMGSLFGGNDDVSQVAPSTLPTELLPSTNSFGGKNLAGNFMDDAYWETDTQLSSTGGLNTGIDLSNGTLAEPTSSTSALATKALNVGVLNVGEVNKKLSSSRGMMGKSLSPQKSFFDKIGDTLFGNDDKGKKGQGVMGTLASYSPIGMLASSASKLMGGFESLGDSSKDSSGNMLSKMAGFATNGLIGGSSLISTLFGGDDAKALAGTNASSVISSSNSFGNLGLSGSSEVPTPALDRVTSLGSDIAARFGFGDQATSASTSLAQSAMDLLPTNLGSQTNNIMDSLTGATRNSTGSGGRVNSMLSTVNDLFGLSGDNNLSVAKGNVVSGIGKIGSDVTLPPTIQSEALVNDTVMAPLFKAAQQVSNKKVGTNANTAAAGSAVRAPRQLVKSPRTQVSNAGSSFHVDDYGIAVMNSILFD
jgi:hypothetical protein